jgi:CBS domain-containing protein
MTKDPKDAAEEKSPHEIGLHIINSDVIVIDQSTAIKDAIETMIETGSSSVLVHDQEQVIVGIVTERDIVRKFSLLDLAGKLDKPVNTLMTRPVLFARGKTLKADVIRMHLRYKLRHFPVLSHDEATCDNLMGIMSVTDILKSFFDPKTEDIAVSEDLFIGKLFLVGTTRDVDSYKEIFRELKYDVVHYPNAHGFFKSQFNSLPPVLIDIDSYAYEELKSLVAPLRAYPGPSLLVTRNPSLVPVFSAFRKRKHHKIFMKPIDISYFHWLLAHEWADLVRTP